MRGAALAVIITVFPLSAAADGGLSPEAVGSVVRSERWNVRRKPHKVEELSGNVTYDKDNRHLRADWALYDHKTKVLQGRGGIRITQETTKGRKIHLTGERGSYDDNSRQGVLSGQTDADPVRFKRVDAAGQDIGGAQCRTVHWDAAQEAVSLEGRRPYLRADEPGWSGAVQADRITAHRGTDTGRRIVAEGRTSGWLYFPHDTDRAVKAAPQP
ncbi:MAG: hypothetical protein ABIJ96_00290 [Elusimicrobiota bacterium]